MWRWLQLPSFSSRTKNKNIIIIIIIYLWHRVRRSNARCARAPPPRTFVVPRPLILRFTRVVNNRPPCAPHVYCCDRVFRDIDNVLASVTVTKLFFSSRSLAAPSLQTMSAYVLRPFSRRSVCSSRGGPQCPASAWFKHLLLRPRAMNAFVHDGRVGRKRRRDRLKSVCEQQPFEKRTKKTTDVPAMAASADDFDLGRKHRFGRSDSAVGPSSAAAVSAVVDNSFKLSLSKKKK